MGDEDSDTPFEVRAIFPASRAVVGSGEWHTSGYFTTLRDAEDYAVALGPSGHGAERVAVYEEGVMVAFEDYRTIQQHADAGRDAAKARAARASLTHFERCKLVPLAPLTLHT